MIDYNSVIVGFDVRNPCIKSSNFNIIDIINIIRNRTHSSNDTKLKKIKIPATIDNLIWNDVYYKYNLNIPCNGLNYLNSINLHINRYISANNDNLVAFTVPRYSISPEFAKSFGIHPISIKLLLEDKNWVFLGFDIVDIQTQLSTIYSFSWNYKELNNIFHNARININKYGLISHIKKALDTSMYFEDLIPEHAPFDPCGVWLWCSN